MHSKNIAFLVEGVHEQRFIQNICPQKKVQRINCNGKNVALSAIAARIVTLCKVLGGKHYPIIVLIDREDRKETVNEMIKILERHITASGITDQIIIGVSDRMIENWILADENILEEIEPEQNKRKHSYEGLNGSATIKKCISGYTKTINGVDLLSRCCASNIAKKSPSFKNFKDRLVDKQIECSWLAR